MATSNNPNRFRIFSVYILRCADGTLYTGVALDPERRLDQHNGKRPGGAKYTKGRGPCHIVARLDGLCPNTARRLELKIKKQPRDRKVAMLVGTAKTLGAEKVIDKKQWYVLTNSWK